MTVVGKGEIFFSGNFFLKIFNLGIFKLNNSPAMDADQVVVMRALHHPFIILLSLPKVMFLHHLFLGQEIEGPVNGRL